MLQRIQTVWLLLVAACAFGTYSLPIYIGKLADGSAKKFLIPDSFLLFPLVFGLGALSLVCIFLFKNRKLQFRLCIIGILVSILVIVLEYYKTTGFKEASAFQSGSYQPGALIPFAIVVFFYLAAKGIKKDEKLVKSLDRLR
jgi:uncharacterized membrane protein YsdA (DUF1294 family)